MFQEGEEQTVENSSVEERECTPQELEEDDSEEIPLSQLKEKSQPEGKGAGNNEEIGNKRLNGWWRCTRR